jgi:hypothetical protein
VIGQEFSQLLVKSGGILDGQIKAYSPITALGAEHDVERIDQGRSDEVRSDSHAEHRTIVTIQTGHD